MSLALNLRKYDKFEIIRSNRKTLGIQVYPDKRVVIRAPLKYSDRAIEQFYTKHLGWVRRKLLESDLYPGLPESVYNDKKWIWLKGEKIQINVQFGYRSNVYVNDQQLIVVQNDIKDTEFTQKLVTQWKRKFASDYFQELLKQSHGRFSIQLPPYQFKIRKMKRQWGNCNNKRVITINTQLIRYPIDCIEYVIVHELAHLKYMNHSKRFYQLVSSVLPNWKQSRNLLSKFSG